MQASATDVGSRFLERSRSYLLTEYRTKLRCAVEAMPPDAFWWRPNESSNSAGNIVLHLIGNVRQWVISGMGGAPDTRYRASEFDTRNGLSSSELLTELERVLVEADRVLGTLTPAMLLESRVIQGNTITIFDAILNVVQHFSHHLGQIIWIAKLQAPGAITFVEDVDGLTRPVWREMIRPPAV